MNGVGELGFLVVEEVSDLRSESCCGIVVTWSQATTHRSSRPFAAPRGTSVDKPRIVAVIGASLRVPEDAHAPRGTAF